MTESQRELYQRDESIRKLFLIKQDEEVREMILTTLIDPQFCKDIKGKNEIEKHSIYKTIKNITFFIFYSI